MRVDHRAVLAVVGVDQFGLAVIRPGGGGCVSPAELAVRAGTHMRGGMGSRRAREREVAGHRRARWRAGGELRIIPLRTGWAGWIISQILGAGGW